jgi:hypothetical protein
MPRGLGALGKYHAKLSEQSANAVDASGAIRFVTFAQPMHTEHTLLINRFEGDIVHGGPRGCLAYRCCIVGIVFATFALLAIGGHQVRRDNARIQPHLQQFARPVVRPRAGLHCQ